MKSMRALHIVVVSDSDQELAFAAALRRMGVGGITTVASLDAARRHCRVGGIDVCIVAVGHAMPDPRSARRGDAPGRSRGIPALLMVARETPALRKLARRAGYAAIVPAGIAPRMLYRRLRAALQGRRAGDPARKRRSAVTMMAPFAPDWATKPGKPTLH